MGLSRKNDAPRVVGFDLGPAAPPSFPGAPAAPPADMPDAPPPSAAWPAANAAPPGEVPSPAWPAADAAPAAYPSPPAPGWPAAEAPAYPPAAAPWAGQAASPVATAAPPAYGGPEYAPRGAFPAPAWTPPAPPKRSLGRMLSLAAGALAVVGGFLVGQQLLGGDEPPAPAPVAVAKKPAKPAKPAGLRLPRSINGVPRDTSAFTKKSEAATRKSIGAKLTPQVGTYAKGRVPTYSLVASKPNAPTASARQVLAVYRAETAKAGLEVGPPTAMPGGLSCARLGGFSRPASVCAWNGKRSTGMLFRLGNDDLRALAKLTARTRPYVEGR